MITAVAGLIGLAAVVLAAITAGHNSATTAQRISNSIDRDTCAALIDDAAEQADTDEESVAL